MWHERRTGEGTRRTSLTVQERDEDRLVAKVVAQLRQSSTPPESTERPSRRPEPATIMLTGIEIACQRICP